MIIILYNLKDNMNFMTDIISDKAAKWLVDNGYYGYDNAIEALVWLYKKGVFNPCVSTVGEACIYGYRTIDSRPFYHVKIKNNDLKAAELLTIFLINT